MLRPSLPSFVFCTVEDSVWDAEHWIASGEAAYKLGLWSSRLWLLYFLHKIGPVSYINSKISIFSTFKYWPYATIPLFLVTKSCLTLCKPMDCSPPGSTVYEISQARILEWVAFSFSRTSSQPRDWIHVSRTDRQIFFYNWATREALNTSYFTPNLSYKSSEQFWITTWPFGSMLKTVDLHLVKIHAKLLFGVNLIKIYKLRRPSGSWLSLGKWRRISFPSYNGDKKCLFPLLLA